MSTGWVKLHRQIMDSESYFSEKFCRNMAWIDLLLLANHKPNIIRKRGIKVKLQRGDVGHGQETLAHRWKWSRAKVKRFLNDLESEGQIKQQKSNVTTCITILNYNEFQSELNPDVLAKRITDDTAKSLQTNSKRYRNKNENKCNKPEFWKPETDKIYNSWNARKSSE